LRAILAMATINFTVQGLIGYGAGGGAAVRDEVVSALDRHGLRGARFDPGLEVFSVELDPAVHSFSDVRRVIEDLGKRKGLVYLAVVMSP